MRLDTKALRYLTAEDWRVLTAVEQGSRNHEVVPTPLITQLAKLRSGAGAAHKSISTLAKANLIARLKNAKYDGYRLTYGGLDYLALHAHAKAGAVYSVGNQIGMGKESDVFVCAAAPGTTSASGATSASASAPTPSSTSNSHSTPSSTSKSQSKSLSSEPPSTQTPQLVLKIHRLGRISFRTVKTNRDYLRKRTSGSWMYMSRLAALKESVFMTTLHDAGFAVPKPLAHNRHTVVMELIDAFPLRQIAEVPDPQSLYAELMQMIVELAAVGLIHGDFNEFNILVREEELKGEDGKEEEILAKEDVKKGQIQKEVEMSVEGGGGADEQGDKLGNESKYAHKDTSKDSPTVKLTPVLIDFPQMVSTSHADAQMYFDRDVNCIKRFFSRRFGFTSDESGPHFAQATRAAATKGKARLDVAAEASGFSRKMAKELEQYMEEVGAGNGDGENDGEGEEDDSDDLSEDETAGTDDDQQVEEEDETGLTSPADKDQSLQTRDGDVSILSERALGGHQGTGIVASTSQLQIEAK